MKPPGIEFAFVHQDQVLARFTLPRGEYFIGRDPECNVVIDIEGIAPLHAHLAVGERLLVEDLGSEEGMFMDGRRLGETAELDTGSAIQFGNAGALRVESRQTLAPPPKNHPAEPAAAEADLAATVSTADEQNGYGACAPRALTPDSPKKHDAYSHFVMPVESEPTPELASLHVIIGVLEESASAQKVSQQEIDRLRHALVDEMDKRRRAERYYEELSVEYKTTAAQLTISTATLEKAPPRPRAKWPVLATAAAVAALAGTGLMKWARHRTDEVKASVAVLHAMRPAAAQFITAAEEFANRGDWAAAIQQLRYALTLAPEQAAWHSRLGDMWMGQFHFDDALAAYRKATQHDVHFADAWEGIAVCERLTRAREETGAPSVSALYAVHRTMLSHGRMAEAVRVAARLSDDADLQQRTWQERLKKGGLDADVRLDDKRRLTVRIRGRAQAHLGSLRGIPAVALWMPDTDVNDLQPLAGIPLEELDVARTMVARVEALRGMPLQRLNLDRTQVEDIFPLHESKLEELRATRTPIHSISALRNMPLRKLDISHTRVVDLQALATLPLRELDASGTRVVDLSPLAQVPLMTLRLDDTLIVDLSPLRRGLLTELCLARTPITSIEPLSKVPIAFLNLRGCSQLRDLKPLSRLPVLQKFMLPSAANPEDVMVMIPNIRFLE